ncbi:MAG TPA: M20/M25/M40 family metallo-hydrolase [Syntrophales bacterium]|nr:M20/M25/M40 family metallo-hydrolase [Syntrophales bacterium]
MGRKMIYALLILLVVVAGFLVAPVIRIRMADPVRPVDGRGPPAGSANSLHDHVHHLSVTIGSRSAFEEDRLTRAKEYILSVLQHQGVPVGRQTFEFEGRPYENLVVTIEGRERRDETVIIGAHYDTIEGTPGADDNASGVAVLLELCRALQDFRPERTLKLIFFTLEEPPAFNTSRMGSHVYAAQARERGERIHGMISLEMVGYYADEEGSQAFPLPGMGQMYSNRGNFIAVVGNLPSRELVSSVAGALRRASPLPVESLAAPAVVPGISFSDHGSFWKMGYRAVMITDTAFYRNPNYHTARDTVETLRFDRMAELLRGMVHVAHTLAGVSETGAGEILTVPAQGG